MIQDCCFTDGIKINQTNSEVDALLEFIVEKDIYGFIDLDMHEGGLALCLMTEMPRLHYLGVTKSLDLISDATKLKLDKHKYTIVIIGDSISSDMITTVNVWVEDRWPALFYCDGNDKLTQLNLYRHLVRFGDYIGTHDYWNKSRTIPELPDFPYGELKPDIVDTDLKFLKHEFQSVHFEPLINTRIAILQRRTK